MSKLVRKTCWSCVEVTAMIAILKLSPDGVIIYTGFKLAKLFFKGHIVNLSKRVKRTHYNPKVSVVRKLA